MGCKIIADKKLKNLISFKTKNASIKDWSTEYLSPIISVKSVNGVNEAIKHNHPRQTQPPRPPPQRPHQRPPKPPPAQRPQKDAAAGGQGEVQHRWHHHERRHSQLMLWRVRPVSGGGGGTAEEIRRITLTALPGIRPHGAWKSLGSMFN